MWSKVIWTIISVTDIGIDNLNCSDFSALNFFYFTSNPVSMLLLVKNDNVTSVGVSVWPKAGGCDVRMRFLSFSEDDFIICLTVSLETADKMGNSTGAHFLLPDLQYHCLQLQGHKKCCREIERERDRIGSLRIDHCAVCHKQCTCTKTLLNFHTCSLIIYHGKWSCAFRAEQCVYLPHDQGRREIISTTYSFRTLCCKHCALP